MATHRLRDVSILKTGTWQGITDTLNMQNNGQNVEPIMVILFCFVFCRDFPEHNVYTTPVFFTSDWLNEYWDTLEVDDYRFVYMGPKGSWYEKIAASF